jgi:hypothetical protein
MTSQTEQFQQLRRLLSPTIKGEKVNAVLEAIASGMEKLVYNVEAVNEQVFVVSASKQYLDTLLANKNLTRPPEIGLTDDIFRELGVEVTNRKQVRDLIHSIVKIMYGYEYIQAYTDTTFSEPFALSDGDNLIFSFDGQESFEISFSSSDFVSIGSATAQEVADAITKGIKNRGKMGSAVVKNEGLGNQVSVVSNTMGASSSVTVLGGKAQNALKFPSIRNTSALATTQWSFSSVGGSVRMTWVGGPNPSLGRVRKNDYVNIFGIGFDSRNKGTFTITKVSGGAVGEAYVEFKNSAFKIETAFQGTDSGVMFFNPKIRRTNSNVMYASVYQTEAKVLQIFIPATTKVVRRDRIGAAHVQPSETTGEKGPYLYDTDKSYSIGSTYSQLTQSANSSTGTVLHLADSSGFPDEQGSIVLDFGTEKEEGPIPYLARPSSNSILISPAYKMKKKHYSGCDCSLIVENVPHKVRTDGGDYSAYVTDIASGRVYTQDLIDSVTATGINLVFTISYPGDEGLSKWGTDYSEKTKIWGE